jgi:hypothetical protein
VSDVVVAIHQPQYLPWLGYFDKVDQCDVLVHLDSVQFQRRGFQNRNRVKTMHGAKLLTVPVVAARDSRIDAVEVAGVDWAHKHTETIRHAYHRAAFAAWFDDDLASLLQRSWRLLVDLNLATLDWAFRRFGITCRQVRSSQLDVRGAKDDLILALCQAVGATVYLSGTGAMAYQDAAKFERAGIALRYQEYRHPSYTQCHEQLGFIGELSALDLLLNEGPQSLHILRSGRSA